jgi:galactokinase
MTHWRMHKRLRTFQELYGGDPAATADAPGRVNLIGEHTDYNGGFVLPAAIPLKTRIELTPRDDRVVRVWSAQFPNAEPVEFEVGAERRSEDWADYVRGSTWSLAREGAIRGFDARVDSRVPLGSGLSSSAALEIALGRALRQVFHVPLDDVALAVAARRAETDFVGAPVGIMDQMACSLADTSGALLIDTRTLEYSAVPLPSSAALIVIDSGVTHKHAGGEYRTRRQECSEAAVALGVAELRDVAVTDLDRVAALAPPLNRRARHVVTENARVLAAVIALKAEDLEQTGRLFVESHASMRDDFEVSIPAIDALVEIACRTPGVYGARLTGGGFGGAIVALADRSRASAAADTIVHKHNDGPFGSSRVIVPQSTQVRC